MNLKNTADALKTTDETLDELDALLAKSLSTAKKAGATLATLSAEQLAASPADI